MTEAELSLANEKLRAEIEHTKLQSEKVAAETQLKLQVEVEKLVAETRKLNTESRWYLMVVGSGFTLAMIAFVKLFLDG